MITIAKNYQHQNYFNMSKTKDYKSIGKSFQKENFDVKGNFNPTKKSDKNKSFLKPKNTNKKSKNYNEQAGAFYSVISSLKGFLGIIIAILGFLTIPLVWIFGKQINWFRDWVIIRENTIKFVFGILFFAMMLNLANLQVISSAFSDKKVSKNFAGEPIEAKRGKILYRDISQGIKNIELATNQIRAEISIDPFQLQKQVKSGQNLEEMLQIISSRTNLNYKKLLEDVQKEINKPEKDLLRYAKIKEGITEEESSGVQNLLNDKQLRNEYGFDSWLRTDDTTFRTYTENKTLAQTLGYTKKFKSDKEETKSWPGCEDIINNNEARGTLLSSGYYLGSGGLEQKYCSALAGLNGRKLGNQDLTDQNKSKNNQVQNGADIYLNIDKNLQKKAEAVLEEAVRFNTNNVGAPKDGCVMVMEAKTGKILALASYPFFDPNFYSQYFETNSKSFLNSCTSNDFEVGSVMKPITVASAIDLNQHPKDGKKYGVDSNFKFTDYNKDGKPFKDGGKKIYITNANSATWKDFGSIGLKEIIRDSINTGIAEITDRMNGDNLFYYLEKKFRFGQETNLNLPGDSNGNVDSFDVDLNCSYCWATKGFGQGFSASMLQLVRGYTAIANGGTLVEPKLISEIRCFDGSVENGVTDGSCIPAKQKLNHLPDEEIISKNAADNVTNYMVAAAEEGFMGNGPTKAMVNGYRIAVKSGTAQVSRPIQNADGSITSCDQTCNTNRGIYDHTFIGFNTGDTRYIIAIKLAEPKPGVISNFSSTTLPTFFSEMMRYTMEYMNVPKEK
jgi:cell division protein FtsI/penicillin-binding protein 2